MLARMEQDALERWNAVAPEPAAQTILPCCGSRAWARDMAGRRPIYTIEQMTAVAGEVWRGLPEAEWREAFRAHPRIGERNGGTHATEQSQAWSAEEQRAAATPESAEQLAHANALYERRFGHIFLICASGKSASEVLAALEQRLTNDPQTELHIAAEEQRRITELRLRRWLHAGAS